MIVFGREGGRKYGKKAEFPLSRKGWAFCWWSGKNSMYCVILFQARSLMSCLDWWDWSFIIRFVILTLYTPKANTSSNMKLVHWPFMGGLLHLVQQGGAWTGSGPAQSTPRCNKCNSPSINCQCTYHCIATWWSVALHFNVAIKGLNWKCLCMAKELTKNYLKPQLSCCIWDGHEVFSDV